MSLEQPTDNQKLICCSNKSTLEIVYYCGPDPNETFFVCKKHRRRKAFSKNIISEKKIPKEAVEN